MSKNRFHIYFYVTMRRLIVPYFKYIAQHEFKPYKPANDPTLILTNHNTNWDFFYFGLTFPRQMYFVASEHIYRLGPVSKVIKFLVDPIPRKKGASSGDTTRMIKERLDKGHNVCMMAEGNRSFNGETGFISPRTAALVKDCGKGLVTYRLHGGYFINPRWGSETRKGKTRGEVVREYSPAEIDAMTNDELNEHIREDLYVNAYADQEKAMIRYKCKHPAEHLETALFLCPDCGSFSTLHSRDDKFFCEKCGLTLRFNEYGYFEGEKVPFKTVLEWDKWQREYLKNHLPTVTDNDTVLFSDEGVHLAEVLPGKGTKPIADGKMSLTRDRLIVEGETVMLQDIQKMSVTLRDTLMFTAAGRYCQIKSDRPYSALKYHMATHMLQGKEFK